MLRVLRENYWILGARNLVRSCVHNCVVCVRFKGSPYTQQMRNLPRERVTPDKPFAKTGVDYAGPFVIRDSPGRGKKTRKCYLAIFVCFVTRAIHVEVVSDYTTAAFLAAFKRFVSVYGMPSLMTSDNITNFQGASRELHEAFESVKRDKDLESWFALEEMEWRFIPPGASNFDGLWEAAVKSVKHHLKRTINNQALKFEQMTTMVYQISSCLNSRPLAPMTDRIDDFSYVTPHGLLGRNIVLSVPQRDLSQTNKAINDRWKRVDQMRDQFWRMWHHDYLLQL